jgi:hypothetical protein
MVHFSIKIDTGYYVFFIHDRPQKKGQLRHCFFSYLFNLDSNNSTALKMLKNKNIEART